MGVILDDNHSPTNYKKNSLNEIAEDEQAQLQTGVHKRIEEALREAEQKAIVEYEKLLDRLASLAQEFGVARDLKEIYHALHNFALASTPCSNICISCIEHGFRTPVYGCCDGQEIDLSGVAPIKLGEDSPQGRALAANTVVILNDFQKAYEGRKLVRVAFDVDPRVPHSALIAPMSVMGRVIGSVEIQAIEREAFNQEHTAAMRMAANLAAVAIENVRLFERERKHEEQLRQSQKMEAVGRLAGGVAHDFNNLLTAILGYSQLMQARLDQASPLHREVEEIQKAGQRAASLTRQLLAFSRKQVLQPKVLDLNTVVTDIDKMLARLIGEDIEMIAFPDPKLGRVKADPGQIEQVIMNLAINARDAMPQGGKLIIQTSNVTLEDSYTSKRSLNLKPGPYVMLAVTDTGYGIDKKILPHIFEPFFTTKEQGKGTGLGLSTVYGIVNQSGGDIWVETDTGRGTTFKIYLPRVDNPAEEQQASEQRESLFSVSETVLLVEDEDVVRNLVREILMMNGYNVLQAANGREALPICEQHVGPIHLMLTDVVMPQMGGRELAERVASLRPEMKVLFMSGYTDDAIVHHGVLDSGIAFIQKPFTPDSLARKVRDMLDSTAKSNHTDQTPFADSTNESFDTIH
jgi:signal transduction histidine kinase/CheY-like chemotaxis protein